VAAGGEGALSQVVTSSKRGRSSQPDDGGAKNISVSHTLMHGVTCCWITK
jgi:hypothetical protein